MHSSLSLSYFTPAQPALKLWELLDREGNGLWIEFTTMNQDTWLRRNCRHTLVAQITTKLGSEYREEKPVKCENISEKGNRTPLSCKSEFFSHKTDVSQAPDQDQLCFLLYGG